MGFAFQPLDTSNVQGALGQLGQVNAQRAADRRAKKRRQMAMVGALAGAGLGVGFAPMLGVGALQAAGAGAGVGSSVFSGNPVGAATGLLGLGGMAQQAQAGSAVQGALGGFMTPGVAPGEMEANAAGVPSLTTEQQQRNAYIGALQGIAPQNPGAALQGASGLLAQDAAASTAAATRALTVRGQDITMRGQDLKAQTASEAVSKREAQIKDLMELRGLDRADAVDLVDRLKDVKITEGGFARGVNRRTNEVEELPIGSGPAAGSAPASLGLNQLANAQRKPGAPPNTLWQASEDATGAGPALAELWANTAGQIPGVPISEQVVDARSFFRQSGRSLVRALSNNPRFPVGEMKAIEKAMDIEPKLVDSPPALRSRLRRLDQMLGENIASQQRIASDPDQPTDLRSAAKASVNDMGNFRRLIGIPRGPQQAAVAIPPPAQREVGKTYDTPRGKAVWRGSGWELVEEER